MSKQADGVETLDGWKSKSPFTVVYHHHCLFTDSATETAIENEM